MRTQHDILKVTEGNKQFLQSESSGFITAATIQVKKAGNLLRFLPTRPLGKRPNDVCWKEEILFPKCP